MRSPICRIFFHSFELPEYSKIHASGYISLQRYALVANRTSRHVTVWQKQLTKSKRLASRRHARCFFFICRHRRREDTKLSNDGLLRVTLLLSCLLMVPVVAFAPTTGGKWSQSIILLTGRTNGQELLAASTADIEFWNRFQACELSESEWTHTAHVCIAWVALMTTDGTIRNQCQAEKRIRHTAFKLSTPKSCIDQRRFTKLLQWRL